MEPAKIGYEDPEAEVGPEYRVDDMVDWYRTFGGNRMTEFREAKDTVFVTSDLLLHVYHLLIDKSFQDIEERVFHPKLKAMSEVLYE